MKRYAVALWKESAPFQARREGGKSRVSFPRFPRRGISTATPLLPSRGG